MPKKPVLTQATESLLILQPQKRADPIAERNAAQAAHNAKRKREEDEQRKLEASWPRRLGYASKKVGNTVVMTPIPDPEGDRKREQFRVEIRALCNKYQITMQEAANTLQFMVPPRYTQEELDAAFKLVQPKPNWKDPIDAVAYLDDAGISLVGEAVTHFTGSMAEFVPIRNRVKRGNKSAYRVIASGYYNCVGA